MQSIQRVFTILCVAACVISGCTEDKPPSQVPLAEGSPTGSGVFTASIDGLPWAAQDAAGMPSGTSTYSGNALHISGGRTVVGDTAEAETIDLFIDLRASQTSIVAGTTYALGTIPAQQGEAEHHDGLTCVCHTNSAQAGTVTITALDVTSKTVSGTFAFNGLGGDGQTHVFSEGKFDVAWK